MEKKPVEDYILNITYNSYDIQLLIKYISELN